MSRNCNAFLNSLERENINRFEFWKSVKEGQNVYNSDLKVMPLGFLKSKFRKLINLMNLINLILKHLMCLLQ